MTILSEGWQVPQRIIKWLGRNTGAFCHADDITAEVFADVLAKVFVEDAQAEGREPWKKLDVVMRGFALLQQNSAEDCVGILSTVDALLKGATSSRPAVDPAASVATPRPPLGGCTRSARACRMQLGYRVLKAEARAELPKRCIRSAARAPWLREGDWTARLVPVRQLPQGTST